MDALGHSQPRLYHRVKSVNYLHIYHFADVALMWQHIYGREGEKPRLQVLFRLQVYASFEVINAFRLYVESAL
jgi:hypothetical protein